MPISNEDQLADIQRVRAAFRESIADPLLEVIRKRGAMDTAVACYALPVEAAAAGFMMTIHQDVQGWHIKIARDVAGKMVTASGTASSLLPAMVQITQSMISQLDAMDSKARSALAKSSLKAAA